MTYYEKHRAIKEGRASKFYIDDKPILSAECFEDVVDFVKNPLNKIKINLVGTTIEFSGKTYELKEDLKAFFHVKWNSLKKTWIAYDIEVVSRLMSELKLN